MVRVATFDATRTAALDATHAVVPQREIEDRTREAVSGAVYDAVHVAAYVATNAAIRRIINQWKEGQGVAD